MNVCCVHFLPLFAVIHNLADFQIFKSHLFQHYKITFLEIMSLFRKELHLKT